MSAPAVEYVSRERSGMAPLVNDDSAVHNHVRYADGVFPRGIPADSRGFPR